MTNIVKGRSFQLILLAAVVLWAAILRLGWRDTSPPGIQTDEAANAWNAWCLLKTGQDEWGQRWPICFTRAFDDYRSSLYIYLLMPFQAAGGMSIYTTRLPAALGGIASVVLLYYIGRRMFDAPTALLAAALLAIMPWHIQFTRWGHEGSLMPLLAASTVAAILWAGLIRSDREPNIVPWRAGLGGVIVGVCFYGYAAIRLYLPIVLLTIGLSLPWNSWRDRRWRRAAMLFVVGLIVTTAPLAWKHLSDPRISQRAAELTPWSKGDSVTQVALSVVQRYLPHFSPSFLLQSGSPAPALAAPAGYGCIQWYVAALLIIGAIISAVQSRRSMSARLLLILLLTYPAGDLIFGHARDPHALRSFPGALWISLTAATAAVQATRWARAKARSAALVIAASLAICGIASHVLFLRSFFGAYNYEYNTSWVRNMDLVQACEWLQPRLASVDAVYCTEEGLTYPYSPMLVLLNYDPANWFVGRRESAPWSVEEPKPICAAFGPIRFIRDHGVIASEFISYRVYGIHPRVVMILRPDEAALAAPHAPVGEVRINGEVWLLLYDFEL